MIKSSNRISYNNQGSAIITALVVSAVLMVLCLSLLAIAYSLFLSQKNTTSDMPQREMLYSAVEMLEKGIEGAEYDPSETPITPTEDATGASISEFWKYLLKEVCTDSWTNTIDNHKYFQLKSIGSVKIIAEMYWELPAESSVDKNGSILYASYCLYDKDMNLQVKVYKTYTLIAKTSITTQTINCFPEITDQERTNIGIYLSEDDYTNGDKLMDLSVPLTNPKCKFEYITDGPDGAGYYIVHKKNGHTNEYFKIELPIDSNIDYWHKVGADNKEDFFDAPGEGHRMIGEGGFSLYAIYKENSQLEGGSESGNSIGSGSSNSTSTKYKWERKITLITE